MPVDEIIKITKIRPFKIFEIHVKSGEKYLIKHPENIFITRQLIVTVDEQEQSILIAPEAVSTITLVDGKN